MIGFGNPTNPTSTHAIYTQVGMNDSALSVMLWLVIFVFSANEPTNLYWPTSKRPYPGRFFRTSVMNTVPGAYSPVMSPTSSWSRRVHCWRKACHRRTRSSGLLADFDDLRWLRMTVGVVSALTLVESLAVLLSGRNSIKFSAMTLSKRSWLLQEIIFLCIVFQESEHHMCDLHGLCCNTRIRRHIGSSMERYLRECLSNAVHAVIQRTKKHDCDAKSAKAGMHPALITTCSKKTQTYIGKIPTHTSYLPWPQFTI